MRIKSTWLLVVVTGTLVTAALLIIAQAWFHKDGDSVMPVSVDAASGGHRPGGDGPIERRAASRQPLAPGKVEPKQDDVTGASLEAGNDAAAVKMALRGLAQDLEFMLADYRYGNQMDVTRYGRMMNSLLDQIDRDKVEIAKTADSSTMYYKTTDMNIVVRFGTLDGPNGPVPDQCHLSVKVPLPHDHTATDVGADGLEAQWAVSPGGAGSLEAAGAIIGLPTYTGEALLHYSGSEPLVVGVDLVKTPAGWRLNPFKFSVEEYQGELAFRQSIDRDSTIVVAGPDDDVLREFLRKVRSFFE